MPALVTGGTLASAATDSSQRAQRSLPDESRFFLGFTHVLRSAFNMS